MKPGTTSNRDCPQNPARRSGRMGGVQSPQHLDYASPQRRSHSGYDLAFAWIRLVGCVALAMLFLGTGVAMWLDDAQRGREGAGVGYLVLPACCFWLAFKAGRDVRHRSR